MMYRNRSKVIKLDAWERAEMRLSLTVLFRRRWRDWLKASGL